MIARGLSPRVMATFFFLIFDRSPMRFAYHTAKILSVMTKQYVCIFLVWVTSAPLGMRLRGREDSVFHANPLPQCLFFPRFQILVLFNRGWRDFP